MYSNDWRADEHPEREPTSRQEITNLLRVVERDLRQARVPGLEPDGRFIFAHNAALQLPTVYLRLHGVRISSAGRHARTFRALQDLLPPTVGRYTVEFDRARRKRHTLMYDQAGAASQHEAEELVEAAEEFHRWLIQEISTRFPEHAPEDRPEA